MSEERLGVVRGGTLVCESFDFERPVPLTEVRRNPSGCTGDVPGRSHTLHVSVVVL